LKKIIRVGMRVRSFHDPEHVFVVDRVKTPDKVFHEKGSRCWWAEKELQPFSAKQKTVARVSAKKLEEARSCRSLAFQAAPVGMGRKSVGTYQRTCLNCGTEFSSKRRNAKFCPTRGAGCRTEYWKRRNQAPVIPKLRLRSERAA
jgi:hypothetical protein